MNNTLKDQLESWMWNKALPVVFKGIEYALLATLIYGAVLMVVNAVNELF